MIQFSKEQMEVLAEYEPYFKSAVYCDYIRAVTASLSEKVADIWREVKDKDYQFNSACGGCVLELFKRVGAAYFAQKDLEEMERAKKKRTPKKKQTNL